MGICLRNSKIRASANGAPLPSCYNPAYVPCACQAAALGQTANSCNASSGKSVRLWPMDTYTGWMAHMKFLSYAYRFASNFLFLAMVYYSLNLIDKYNQRAIVAIMVLIYSG